MKKGPRKLETSKTIAGLEKRYRKTRKPIWLDIAERLKKSRRKRASVNLWRLERLAQRFSGKTLVVPGKVLGTGEIKEKATIIALEYSLSAKKKIGETGNAITLAEAVKKELKPENMVIVK